MAASDDRGEQLGEYGNAKISVWWDLYQCGLGGCDARRAVESIMSALAGVGYDGTVAISAYGHEETVPGEVKEGLFDAGVRFCGVESADVCIKRILEDMLFWALDNPAPANYLLLSGDCDFSYALHRLASKRYNILLAQPEDASTCLVATAKTVWLWTSVLAGEPSLDIGDVFQYCNNVCECCCNRAKNSTSESESEIVQNNESAAFPSEIGNDELSSDGNSDNNLSNVSNCSAGKVVGQANTGGGTLSSQFFIAPHEFFRRVKSGSSSGSSALSSTHSGPDSPSSHNELANVHNLHSSFAPDEIFHKHQFTQNKHPTRRNSAPDGLFLSDSPTYPIRSLSDGLTAITDTDIFSSEHQEIIQHNSYTEDFPGSAYPLHGFCSFGGWGASGHPEPSAHVQGLIGVILLALHTLKTEKIIPTEDNITDCIRCGNLAHQTTDVRTALNHAIEHEMVVSRKLGALVIYTGAKSGIWPCLNPLGGSQKDYPKTMWGKLQKYLSSPDGQYKMKISSSRYEAATYLRQACPKNLALGEVLQVLNMVIEIEKWMSVHQSGWQPISIALAVVTSEGDYQRCGANW